MSLLRRGNMGVLALSLLAASCGGDDAKSDDDAESDEDQDVGPATGALCDPKLTYEADVAPFMSKYCTRCHDSKLSLSERMMAPLDHNFETEQGVLKELAHIDQQAGAGPKATNTSMPIAGFPAPSEAERQKLSAWVACQSAD